ncbi:hypothetical protein HK101_001222 [Irineochytrium annulatum]|nr:hypothetical protein HK101_001222 [Irineochytrium annulatum]
MRIGTTRISSGGASAVTATPSSSTAEVGARDGAGDDVMENRGRGMDEMVARRRCNLGNGGASPVPDGVVGSGGGAVAMWRESARKRRSLAPRWWGIEAMVDRDWCPGSGREAAAGGERAGRADGAEDVEQSKKPKPTVALNNFDAASDPSNPTNVPMTLGRRRPNPSTSIHDRLTRRGDCRNGWDCPYVSDCFLADQYDLWDAGCSFYDITYCPAAPVNGTKSKMEWFCPPDTDCNDLAAVEGNPLCNLYAVGSLSVPALVVAIVFGELFSF